MITSRRVAVGLWATLLSILGSAPARAEDISDLEGLLSEQGEVGRAITGHATQRMTEQHSHVDFGEKKAAIDNDRATSSPPRRNN